MTTATDDIELPVDSAPSKLSRRSRPTGGENPDDIGLLDARIAAFRSDHPKAIIDPTYEWWQSDSARTYVFRARVWLDRDSRDDEPDAVGHASTGSVTEEPYATHALETAESVAVGRALRFLGYGSTG